MSRYTKTAITQLSANEQAAIDAINKNLTDIQSAIADTVSRSGNTPTHMTADLDMNGQRLLNVPAPRSDTDLVRKQDVVSDINMVQQLVNTATNAAAQALESATIAQEVMQDSNVVVVGQDLLLDENSKIKQVAANKDNIDTVALDIENVSVVGSNISNVNAVADNETNINAVNSNKTNIDTVAGSIGNVNAVGDSISNVNTVAGISSNVTTVAGISSAVSNVSSIKDDVSTVGGISSSVSSVASNATNINTVASDISDVVAVGSNIAKVTAVADNETNINAVNANKTNIDTVAGVSSNVTTVAGIASDVASVSSIASNVTAVANNATNINAVNANKTNIDSVANNISNVNAVGSNISNVNTVAGDSANIATVVNNMTAINAAPTYAAQAKQWAIGDPSEPANGSAKYWADRAHVYTEGVLHEDLISNCITEIPQDIKLELNNGTLTLKSGSVITRPNGSQYQTTQEQGSGISVGSGSFVGYIIPYNTNGILQEVYRYVTSGSSFPENPATHAVHYDTTNNKIYMYSTNTQTWQETNMCLPIATVTVTSGVITSIDQVFNGFGYIGSSMFVLPGVKALAPNGINLDGTLKSTMISFSSLCIRTFANLTGDFTFWLTTSKQIGANYTSNISYNEKENILQQGVTAIVGAVFATARMDSAQISNFEVRKVTRLATTEMLDEKQDTLAFDTTPTQNSTNPVTSGGIYTALSSKANTSLNNLDSTGQMVIDSQNGTISNCILDIPQDINLTLSNGTLTLKSGSIVTFADGSQYQITTDKTYTSANGNICLIFWDKANNSLISATLSKCGSGTTDPLIGTTFRVWFDTANNKVFRYGASDIDVREVSLPLCIINTSSSQILSIDQIFNGAGYIGHHAFVLPGVSAIIPYGFNTDGTLKNIQHTLSSLIIVEMTTGQAYTGYNRRIPVMHDDTLATVKYNWRAYKEVNNLSEADSSLYFRNYVKKDNLIYTYTGAVWANSTQDCWGTPFVEYNYNGTNVTVFDVRQPVRLATTEMVDNLQTTVNTKANDSEVVKLTGTQTITGNKTFSGSVALGGSATATTPPVTDNDTSVATTGFVGNKFQVVDELPASPTIGVFYFISEE